MRDFAIEPRPLPMGIEELNREDAKDAKKSLKFSLRPLRLCGEILSISNNEFIPTRGVIIHA
jgi:hypothetical protein